MLGIVGRICGLNIIEHVVDNYIFDTVQPIKGSVVYCDFVIAASLIQHSGIYVGDGRIVHLNGKGEVELVTPKEFVGNFKCGTSIYVSCDGTEPVGDISAAEVAISEVGNQYNYNVAGFNCHQFASGCIQGLVYDFNSDDINLGIMDSLSSTLTALKLVCRYNLDSNNWRVWER